MATQVEPATGIATARIQQQSALTRNGRTVWMVTTRELIRLKRAPSRVIAGLAQPLLFLFVMGAGMSRLISTRAAAGIDYQKFLFPGILSMSILTSALFSAVSIVWDREFGFLREMLVAPVSRAGLVIGKAVGGGTVAVAQGLILIIAAPIIGVHLDPLRVVGLLVALLLLAFSITSFGIVLSSRMQRMESFQMLMALVMQPMIFLSGAVFPLRSLPTWLTVITRANPATYGVDLVRRVVLEQAVPLTFNGRVVPMWADALVIISLGVLMLSIAVRLFSRTE